MERPRFDIVASGERMKEIRKQRNISVKQVMEYMGFESTQAVYKWEAGKCYPQADNLVALAILYNVSPMELLVEEDLVSSSTCLWGSLVSWCTQRAAETSYKNKVMTGIVNRENNVEKKIPFAM